MKNALIFLLVMACTGVYGQNYSTPRTLGDKAFSNKNYYEAAFYYKKAAGGLNLIKKTQIPYQGTDRVSKNILPADKLYVSYMLAESYRLYENYLEAEGWYYLVINENNEGKYPLARLWYGVCLRANQHFDESIKQLEQFNMAYKGETSYKEIANKEINTCMFAKEQYQFPVLIDVMKMKGTWNTDGSDYAIIKRDQNYWFTSSRLIKDDKKRLNRIYGASAADGFKPEIISFKQDEKKPELEYGTPSLSPSGKRMYLTRWYKEGAKTLHGIYSSDYQNNEWSTPKKLNGNVNADGFNAIQPFITPDGKHMYFVSNKPGGFGGDDIWMSDLDNDGNPISSVNLGKNINSQYDEQAPYYDPKTNHLIYSSKGFLGLGGFDFFESFDYGGQWAVARNMGYPFNSAKDDLYYYPDNANENKFYISSDRQSECCLELFEVYDKRYILTGLVVDCDTRKTLTDVKVSLVDSLSKQTFKKLTLNASAKYTFNVNTRRPYNLVIEKDGYFTKSIPVSTATGRMSNDTLYNPEICLQGFKVNKPIELKNILYDFNSVTLRPESKAVLNTLITLLRDNPKIKIELASHTDGIGSDALNRSLSQRRAQACVDYIIGRGVKEDRIFAKGYGKTKPIAPNTLPDGKDNPEGRQKNRRTEFTVLKTE